MHTKNAGKCNAHKDRIDCVRYVFRVLVLRISVFWWHRKPCICCIACVVYDSLETACRPMSRPMWHTANAFLWQIRGSSVSHNVVMSNFVMSNYVTLRRQQPVSQFSLCPQRNISLLWPVIKLQGDSTSDHQMVTSDGGGRSQAWPLITLLLQTFVIRLGHLWNSRKTVA